VLNENILCNTLVDRDNSLCMVDTKAIIMEKKLFFENELNNAIELLSFNLN